MNVYERFKSSNFEHLEIDVSALYLIARRSTPEPVRAEVIRRASKLVRSLKQKRRSDSGSARFTARR
jgi:hypothetical protein